MNSNQYMTRRTLTRRCNEGTTNTDSNPSSSGQEEDDPSPNNIYDGQHNHQLREEDEKFFPRLANHFYDLHLLHRRYNNTEGHVHFSNGIRSNYDAYYIGIALVMTVSFTLVLFSFDQTNLIKFLRDDLSSDISRYSSIFHSPHSIYVWGNAINLGLALSLIPETGILSTLLPWRIPGTHGFIFNGEKEAEIWKQFGINCAEKRTRENSNLGYHQPQFIVWETFGIRTVFFMVGGFLGFQRLIPTIDIISTIYYIVVVYSSFMSLLGTFGAMITMASYDFIPRNLHVDYHMHQTENQVKQRQNMLCFPLPYLLKSTMGLGIALILIGYAYYGFITGFWVYYLVLFYNGSKDVMFAETWGSIASMTGELEQHNFDIHEYRKDRSNRMNSRMYPDQDIETNENA